MEIDQILLINLVSCLLKRLLYLRVYGMFLLFSSKINLFVTSKSDEDPFAHGSALV
jgi:hypothetical protein